MRLARAERSDQGDHVPGLQRRPDPPADHQCIAGQIGEIAYEGSLTHIGFAAGATGQTVTMTLARAAAATVPATGSAATIGYLPADALVLPRESFGRD